MAPGSSSGLSEFFTLPSAIRHHSMTARTLFARPGIATNHSSSVACVGMPPGEKWPRVIIGTVGILYITQRHPPPPR